MKYVCIHPKLIRPWVSGKFAVYLKQEGQYVLYTNKGASYTTEHRDRLMDLGVSSLYIPEEHMGDYEFYLRENLGEILTDKAIPLEERANAWYQASVALARNVFEEKLPKPLYKSKFNQIKKLVKDSISFFDGDVALNNMAQLISRGYKNYNHSIGTMVLTSFVLQGSEQVEENALVKVGIGALLHDVGLTKLPKSLLEKNPKNFSGEERDMYRTHPSLGIGLCINLPLAVETYHCILFHHEQANGKGFPSGIDCENSPAYVRALAVCNAYDGLTRTKAYRPAHTPYEALQRMESRKDCYDQTMVKRLIMILSDAKILDKEQADSASRNC